MSRISDPVLLAIVENRSYGGLPRATAKAVHHLAHLLLAATASEDVSTFTSPIAAKAGRLTAPAIAKWGISFVMASFGPDDLRLEKLATSWSAKSTRPSRRRRQAKS